MTITLTVVMVFVSATSPAIPPTEAPIGAETVETREAVTPRNDGNPVEEKRPGCGFDYVGSP